MKLNYYSLLRGDYLIYEIELLLLFRKFDIRTKSP